ncbi:MAG TPA: phosphoenolpyruvate--protein phosphotransferase [Thauera sp.]|jgi:phosphotransferase system enzyme I (PtsI)|uniref:phosphoenolpyruvate--protein phosphotransferase n=1 Tax=Thauera sp. TaxID=1905334 RepID=UPI000FB11F0C|nr:phosphoenolpyruvate--protein phosphotransferase [Thauera sp.]MCB1945941.1 phosphoenolpyruvate--protein phosphotransferase [Thauera sp.]RTL26135.1 MAG: phosphoenolpyruvate--protein phosphotransferase [Rhodocyclaceae bacterium]HPE04101.1 phosphoenolpyruvate--protein phosphotransferase [Thauera sp.]HRV79185.1 phosphoenolpyruvate--protein phosphotransferase [Thauera sp.]
MPFTLHGLAVSQGIAIGHVHLVSHALLEVNHYHVAPRYLDEELARLDEALATVQGELIGLKAVTTAGQAHSEVGAFVDLQLMMLADPMLVDAARDLVTERRCNAEWALVQQMEHLVEQFRQIEDPYLRERQADVVQVVERLVKVLLGHPGHLPPRRRDGLGSIVVAHDLSPADTIGFRDHNIAGFVTDVGGPTSHTAIVARSLKIPAVVGLHHVRDLLEDDELIIVDGTRGVIIVAPDEEIVEEYRLRRSELEIERSKLNRLRDTRATTLDGEEVNLLANIEGPKDLPAVKTANADGIGLYRTEFLFIGRDTLPDEEEQYEAYRAVVKALPGKSVTIRTFDVGADKALNGAQAREEPNPALGLRAVRYSLAEPKMFKTQLRALLRASAHGRLQIMVPMLAHAQEVDQCLALIEKAKAELRAEKVKFDEGIRIGGMIEVPAAALSLGMFIRRLAFLSIGTNDLIQYTLAIDRSDEAVAHLYDPLHPAVLKLIAGTISSGARFGLPVSVCGEMAGDPLYTELLLGMGLRNFSMHPGSILEIKQQILRADLGELAPKVQRILKMDEPARIREAVERLTT